MKRAARVQMLIAVSAIAVPRLSSSQHLVPADSASLRTYFSRAAEFGFSGSILVKHKGRTILHDGFGFSDRAQQVRMAPASPMMIGSIAKPLTATAILALAEEGKLSLDDNVSKFFPDAPADKRNITVRQLLTHSSGLPYLGSNMFGTAERSVVMKETLALPLAFTPGARYDYSTPGYVLLAGIAEKVSGQSFESYLAARVFNRSGMKNTGFTAESNRWAALPSVVSISDGRTEPSLAQLGALSGAVGGGTVVSTVGDLALWWESILNGRLLSPASRTLVTDSAIALPNGNIVTHMLNRVRTRQRTYALLHAGDLGGYSAELRWYPVEQVLAAVTSNVRDGGIGYRDPVMSVIRRFVAGDSIPLPPVVVTSTAAHRAYVGSWQLAGNERIRFWSENNELFAGADGPQGIGLLAGGTAASIDSSVLSQLSLRAVEFLKGVARGDSSSVFEQMHASIPREARGIFLREWRIPLGDASVAQDARTLTVVHNGGAEFTVYVNTQSPAGRRIVGLRFSGAHVASAQPPAEWAAVRSLRPSTDGELAAFDLFTERSLIVRRVNDREVELRSGDSRVKAAAMR